MSVATVIGIHPIVFQKQFSQKAKNVNLAVTLDEISEDYKSVGFILLDH